MTGVAGPLLRNTRTRVRGVRFLVGLAIGGAAGGAVLAVPVYLLGRLVQPLPAGVRLTLLVAVCVLLAVADFTQRTPHVWRQVPQQLVNKLPSGSLGLTWGFDLGLLFTTQKTTSMVWVAMAALVLLEPSLAAVALIGVSVVATLVVAAMSLTAGADDRPSPNWSRKWLKHIRRGSAVVIVAVTAVTVAQALAP
jgi:hypothetical protein